MKVFFTNISSTGHVVPTMGLVQELVRANVEVVYLELEAHRQELEAAGARFRAIGEFAPYQGPITKTNAALPAVLAHCALEGVGMVIDAITAEQPDVVIHDGLCLWGRLAADLVGVPRISSIASAALSRRILSEEPIVRRWLGDETALRPVRDFVDTCFQSLQAHYGCAPEDMYGPVLNTAPSNLVYLTRSLQPYASEFGEDYLFCGSSHRVQQARQEFDWSQIAGRRLVYMSFGTAHDPGSVFYAQVAQAMHDLDAVLVTVATPSMTAGLPITWPKGTVVCPLGSAPQVDLLERADLFISHVGGGAVREAAWTATPVLALPQTFEQDLLTQRLVEHGVARRLSDQPMLEEIAENIRSMLEDDQLRTCAVQLSAQQRRITSRRDAVATILGAKCVCD
ncbi:glycosyltransferase (plasmid) [Candidatus Fukatsuia symbiotica]|uniref:glycosyltransferase n=1 Tax=Candidatus Fukatsuia symbiotica TaxID=1878942 RepID=UPI0013C3335E|nr:glycosyltransferase [Candidatus Fukatsuia symbiotica]MEA9445911.1 glycosyltransferase [Candidatus Fukatsuia symbiotica]